MHSTTVTLKTGAVPGESLKQITHGLWITGAQWADWLSYHPAFPEPLQTRLIRVVRDEVAIAAYDRAARAFLAEVDTELAAIRTMTALAETMTASSEQGEGR